MIHWVDNPMARPIEEQKRVGVAFCEECQCRLFDDEEFLELDGNYFCDEYCLKEYLGVKAVEGWEIRKDSC